MALCEGNGPAGAPGGMGAEVAGRLRRILEVGREAFLAPLLELVSRDTRVLGHGIEGGLERNGQEYLEELLRSLGADTVREPLTEELVREGINGALATPDDSHALERAVARAMEVRRHHCRRWFETHHSISAFSQRLERWLLENGVSLDGSCFYSDSRNDLPLLEQVDNPVAVDPCAELRSIASARGWPVISLRG